MRSATRALSLQSLPRALGTPGEAWEPVKERLGELPAARTTEQVEVALGQGGVSDSLSSGMLVGVSHLRLTHLWQREGRR